MNQQNSTSVRWQAANALRLVSIIVSTVALSCGIQGQSRADEAMAGFDNKTNGYEAQGDFDSDKGKFEEVENIETNGLGPVYNGTSCVGCHQNPVTGSASQISVLRAGHFDHKKHKFVEPPGGSLIFQRAIDAAIQAHVPPGNEIRTLRMATNVLGNGYVECIADEDILKVQQGQPLRVRGAIVLLPALVGLERVEEVPKPGGQPGEKKKKFVFKSTERIGRFGWKCQDASLLNFSAGAYFNEMGVTSPVHDTENSSNGRDVSQYDKVEDPEDKPEADPANPGKYKNPFGGDVMAFTRFMRSTKAPPEDSSVAPAGTLAHGRKLFKSIGCAVCHVSEWTTVAAGAKIADFTVPDAMGGRTLHPYSDFMLHDVASGDGIVQTQHAQKPVNYERWSMKLSPIKDGPHVYRSAKDLYHYEDIEEKHRYMGTRFVNTASMIRTAPLWGLRTRPQLMHDGLSLTVTEAIERHGNQGKYARAGYRGLNKGEKSDLLAFLSSL